MKRIPLLLAAATLLAFVSLLFLGGMAPAHAVVVQDPEIGQTDPVGLPVVFNFWGRILVAGALGYLIFCFVSFIWEYSVTRKSH